MTEKLLKVKDLQEYLQLSRQGVYAMLKKGTLPKPLRLGRVCRWKPETIEAFLEKKENEHLQASKACYNDEHI